MKRALPRDQNQNHLSGNNSNTQYKQQQQQHRQEDHEKIDTKKSNKSQPKAKQQKAASKKNTNDPLKVFVGGLPKELMLEEFQEYFEKYGEIEDIAIINDKKTREPRGFGFVTYKEMKAVRQVLQEYPNHYFHEKWVECKIAFPRPNESDMSEHSDKNPVKGDRRNHPSFNNLSSEYEEEYHDYVSGQSYPPRMKSYANMYSSDSIEMPLHYPVHYGAHPGPGYHARYGMMPPPMRMMGHSPVPGYINGHLPPHLPPQQRPTYMVTPPHAPHSYSGYEGKSMAKMYYSRTYSTNTDPHYEMEYDSSIATIPSNQKVSGKRNSIMLSVNDAKDSPFAHPDFQQPFSQPIRNICALKSSSFLIEPDAALANPRALKTSKTNVYEEGRQKKQFL